MVQPAWHKVAQRKAHATINEIFICISGTTVDLLIRLKLVDKYVLSVCF